MMSDKATTASAISTTKRMSTMMSGLTAATTSTTTTGTSTGGEEKVSFMTSSTTAAYLPEEDYFEEDEEEEEEEEEECLPFALQEEHEVILQEGGVLVSSPLYSSSTCNDGNHASSHASTAPSSVASQPLTPSSTCGGLIISEEEEHDSVLLSAAAAISAVADDVIQHACSSSPFSSSSSKDYTTSEINGKSLDFSQLMREADDTVDSSNDNSFSQTIIKSVHDENIIIEEEEEETKTIISAAHSEATPMMSNTVSSIHQQTQKQEENGIWGYLFRTGEGQTQVPSRPIISPPVQQSMRSGSINSSPLRSYDYIRHPSQIYSRNNIKALQTSPSSFRLSTIIPLQHPRPLSISSSACSSVRDVIDIVANPDLLKLWCDSISCVLLIETIGDSQSDNVDSSVERKQDLSGKREYDGEWVKITTSTLIPPKTASFCSRPTSCLSKSCILTKAYLGFPTHGNVTMFVERSRGQIGFTLGPFPDGSGILVSHTITVYSLENDSGVEIVDEVRISLEGEDDVDGENILGGGCNGCCSGCSLPKSCCKPRITGHMSQAISSLEKLRALIEVGGETAAFGGTATNSGIAAPLLMGGGGGNSCGSSLRLGMEQDDGRTPLLG